MRAGARVKAGARAGAKAGAGARVKARTKRSRLRLFGGRFVCICHQRDSHGGGTTQKISQHPAAVNSLHRSLRRSPSLDIGSGSGRPDQRHEERRVRAVARRQVLRGEVLRPIDHRETKRPRSIGVTDRGLLGNPWGEGGWGNA